MSETTVTKAVHPHKLSPAEIHAIDDAVRKQTAKALKPVEDEKRRAQVRLRLHFFALIASGVIMCIVVTLKLDEHNAIVFSFGPLGPSILQEILDFIKRL